MSADEAASKITAGMKGMYARRQVRSAPILSATGGFRAASPCQQNSRKPLPKSSSKCDRRHIALTSSATVQIKKGNIGKFADPEADTKKAAKKAAKKAKGNGKTEKEAERGEAAAAEEAQPAEAEPAEAEPAEAEPAAEQD